MPTAADLCVQGVFIVGVAWGHHHHPVAACCQCNRQGAQDVAQAACLAPGGNLAAIGGRPGTVIRERKQHRLAVRR